jgi:hypothetical protein
VIGRRLSSTKKSVRQIRALEQTCVDEAMTMRGVVVMFVPSKTYLKESECCGSHRSVVVALENFISFDLIESRHDDASDDYVLFIDTGGTA